MARRPSTSVTVLAAAVLIVLGGCPGTTETDLCASVTCAPGRTCVDGKCQRKLCTGNDCPVGSTCVSGVCVTTCSGSESCTGGLECCSGYCVDTQNSTSSCGACGKICGAGADTCSLGLCRCGVGPECGAGLACCQGSCVAPSDAGACPKLPDAGAPDGPTVDLTVPELGFPDQRIPDQLAPDQLAPDAGPNCGNKLCDGKETCVSCPADCGKCVCTPNKTEDSYAGCQPCQKKSHTCKANGTWGPWTACAYFCTGTYYCVNNKCAACWPATTKTQTCPCGTQTATCDSSGSWGSWSTCQTTCSSGFTCSSSSCIKQYPAYIGGGGPDCGYKYSSGSYTYYRCQPGDYCISSSQKLCRKYETPKKGDLYHAATSGTGADCGYKYSSGTYTYYLCLPGDYCQSSSQKLCSYAGTACGANYHAASSGVGPQCGYKYSSGTYTYYECQPGDYCVSSSQKLCRIATTCPAGSSYHAYAGAGGVQCGYKYSSGSYTYFYCKPLDTCSSSSQKLCKM